MAAVRFSGSFSAVIFLSFIVSCVCYISEPRTKDLGDGIPIFERGTSVTVNVHEDNVVDSAVVFLKASVPNRKNETVTLAFDNSTNKAGLFAFDEDGFVVLAKPVDRETSSRHEFKILAISSGTPPKTATATVTVLVQDVNDNAPKLSKKYSSVLNENLPAGQKIFELTATDADDILKENGPPFAFKIDPKVDADIRASFKIENDRTGAGGDGVGIVKSLRPLDREQRKEYKIPIIIEDAGDPVAMTGNDTLLLVVGDINDNKMQPGSKNITVYSYMGQSHDTEIGRVYVYDLDDWDLPDKMFFWDTYTHPGFTLDGNTGMLSMKHGTPSGIYNLRFSVYDRKYANDVTANVTVIVKAIPQEAVKKSGSIRIAGTSAEDFIRTWDDKTRSVIRSKADLFRDKLAKLLKVKPENVNVFSVQQRKKNSVTDVRFSAHGYSYYFQSAKLNGLVSLHRSKLEEEIGINITMGINECMNENEHCNGSCTNSLVVNPSPYKIDTNRTALVGFKVDVIAECTCKARNFTKPDTCKNTQNYCLNGGRCNEDGANCGQQSEMCTCPLGYDGPRCQKTARSFHGDGWAWFKPLEMCDNSHLSLEFITHKSDGQLLYNGPLVDSQFEDISADFISLELENGHPRLLIDFGSGTLELIVRTPKTLDDGEWHRLDVFWDTKSVRLVVDFCQSGVVFDSQGGSIPKFNSSICQAQGVIPSPKKYLNVNTPLQLGGISFLVHNPVQLNSQLLPRDKHFDGCIRNVIHNSKLYDLAEPAHSENSIAGCPQIEETCLRAGLDCGEHGVCVGNMTEVQCECLPGYTGPSCEAQTTPVTFKAQSFVKYNVSFEPQRFKTQVQLRFRTKEANGELFRVTDRHGRQYGILEIKNSRLRFKYNLNDLRMEEKDVWLTAIAVNDGRWHTVKVARYGSAAMLELDGGEGRRYNETFAFEGHQWLAFDRQEGVFAGGKPEFLGPRVIQVPAGFQNGCIDDVRLDGKLLLLPSTTNGTKWSTRNVEASCQLA